MTLHPVGSRYVGDPIPVRGYTSDVSGGKYKLVLQQSSSSTNQWSTRATMHVQNGAYEFPPQLSSSAGTIRFRAVLYGTGDRRLDTSNVITVEAVAVPPRTLACENAPSRRTCPQPAPLDEQQTLEAPDCPRLVVTTYLQTRTVHWRWHSAVGRWVQKPTPWKTAAASGPPRPAGLADCVKVVDHVPAHAALPDLRIKDLTRCGKGDLEATGGTCFVIVPSAPYSSDFPSLTGRRLLKFGVITVNVGTGPTEIVADRSSSDAVDWEAYQNYYDAHGNHLGSTVDPAVQFYFAGDGHDHWHVRDFDDYELLDATGTQAARAEKHGYCMQDNTTYDPMQGKPGVSAVPVYIEGTACGDGLPNALAIVHGVSVGWGDTYPTSLPDQAVDITGLPDGVYTVRVHADARGAVWESNEANNVATVKIKLRGDTVKVVPGTSAGGVA